MSSKIHTTKTTDVDEVDLSDAASRAAHKKSASASASGSGSRKKASPAKASPAKSGKKGGATAAATPKPSDTPPNLPVQVIIPMLKAKPYFQRQLLQQLSDYAQHTDPEMMGKGVAAIILAGLNKGDDNKIPTHYPIPFNDPSAPVESLNTHVLTDVIVEARNAIAAVHGGAQSNETQVASLFALSGAPTQSGAVHMHLSLQYTSLKKRVAETVIELPYFLAYPPTVSVKPRGDHTVDAKTMSGTGYYVNLACGDYVIMPIALVAEAYKKALEKTGDYNFEGKVKEGEDPKFHYTCLFPNPSSKVEEAFELYAKHATRTKSDAITAYDVLTAKNVAKPTELFMARAAAAKAARGKNGAEWVPFDDLKVEGVSASIFVKIPTKGDITGMFAKALKKINEGPAFRAANHKKAAPIARAIVHLFNGLPDDLLALVDKTETAEGVAAAAADKSEKKKSPKRTKTYDTAEVKALIAQLPVIMSSDEWKTFVAHNDMSEATAQSYVVMRTLDMAFACPTLPASIKAQIAPLRDHLHAMTKTRSGDAQAGTKKRGGGDTKKRGGAGAKRKKAVTAAAAEDSDEDDDDNKRAKKKTRRPTKAEADADADADGDEDEVDDDDDDDDDDVVSSTNDTADPPSDPDMCASPVANIKQRVPGAPVKAPRSSALAHPLSPLLVPTPITAPAHAGIGAGVSHSAPVPSFAATSATAATPVSVACAAIGATSVNPVTPVGPNADVHMDAAAQTQAYP